MRSTIRAKSNGIAAKSKAPRQGGACPSASPVLAGTTMTGAKAARSFIACAFGRRSHKIRGIAPEPFDAEEIARRTLSRQRATRQGRAGPVREHFTDRVERTYVARIERRERNEQLSD